jgi:hypothetical protein
MANLGGGGVWMFGTFSTVGDPVKFIMEGGTISNNHGSGVSVGRVSVFTMSGGTINDNTNGSHGGGVLSIGNFTMSGGIIRGNKAPYGGADCSFYVDVKVLAIKK